MQDPRQPTTLRAIVRTAIVAVAVAIATAAGYVVTDDDDGKVVVKSVPAAPPATAIDGPDRDTKRDDALPLAPAAQAELERGATATDRPGDTHRELADPLREYDDPSTSAPGVLQGPLAAQEFPGCRTRFVRNFSSRNGATPRIIVWHQTVSRDRPGRADQDGLTALANSPRSSVSWHLLIGGRDGLCTFNVPLHMKAWTQANANPFSLGIEVQAFGDEPSYVSGPGKARLLAVTRELGRRYSIPMRRGLVQNCRPVRSGIVEHYDLGVCGGGHVDVASTRWQRNPSGPELAGWNVSPLIAELAGPPCSAVCRRARDLRARNRATHAELRRRRCAPADETRSARCAFLHRRDRAIHAAAKRESVRLT